VGMLLRQGRPRLCRGNSLSLLLLYRVGPIQMIGVHDLVLGIQQLLLLDELLDLGVHYVLS